ncbi:hypothetical protein KSE_18260 [Kitasatospora setae KM-6054]|uniref:Uncharacterized protein n=1 Tax=Kitasatospora setae (strain ATCC 33774 / DSM 43861 / JCM 3304 / KCC A-0304 / NBRC 14216 / KM-6054) TaxID=452652 RepID=E4N8X0_KITSK|nr:hypothetical protein KSE_18260 [Kitasatospora setae KM-6054]
MPTQQRQRGRATKAEMARMLADYRGNAARRAETRYPLPLDCPCPHPACQAQRAWLEGWLAEQEARRA